MNRLPLEERGKLALKFRAGMLGTNDLKKVEESEIQMP